MPNYKLEIGPVINRSNLSQNSLDGLPKFSSSPLKKGEFEINGVRFPIDPQNISIYEENFNHKHETLRTRESTKIRSGHSRITISVQALFTGISVGHDGDNNAAHSLGELNRTLFPILYSLKRMPLCFIDNELIRRNLPIISFEDENGNLTGENIGAFIKMVNIGTVPGMPHTISAEFQFVWYNHRPFTPTLRFRKDWVDTKGKVREIATIYEEEGKSESSNPTVKAQIAASARPARSVGPHLGRLNFIKNYGHPSRAFNATTHFTNTLDIRESQPLLQYLWPRLSLEFDVEALKGYAKDALRDLPEFKINSFDQTLEFGFFRVRTPSKQVLDELYEITDANRAESVTKDRSYKSADRKTGPLTRADVQKWARELHVHESVLLAAITINSEQTRGLQEERDAIIHSIFNNALRKGQSAWDYVVGPGNVTGKQGGRRKYATSKLPSPTELARNIGWVENVLRARLQDAFTQDDVTGFIHPGSMVPKEYLARVRSGELKVRDIPIEERYAYADEVTTKWQDGGADLLYIEGLDPYKVRFFSQSRTLSPNSIRAQAEELLAGMPERESKRLEDHIDIDPKDAMEVVREDLGLDSKDDIKEEIKKAKDLSDEKKLNISAIADLASEGWILRKNIITGKVALINEIALRIPEGTASIIPLSINVGFGSNLAVTPLEGHRFPTVQYIGGQHTAATISLRCEGEEGRRFLSDLKSMVNFSEESAIHFREFTKRRGVKIGNELINGLGISTAIIEDIAVDTVPGNPEGLTVTIRMIDSTVNESRDPILLGKSDVSIDDVLNETLKLVIEKEWLDFQTKASVVGDDIIERVTDAEIRRSINANALPKAGYASGITQDLRIFEEEFGLARLQFAAASVKAKAIALAAREQISEEAALRRFVTAPAYIADVAQQEQVSKAERLAAPIVLHLVTSEARVKRHQDELDRRTDLENRNAIPFDENPRDRATLKSGEVFIVPGLYLTANIKKEGMNTLLAAEIEGFAEEFKDHRFNSQLRVDITQLFEEGFNPNKLIKFNEYRGYKGAFIDSDKPVLLAAVQQILGTEDEPGLLHDPKFRTRLHRLAIKAVGILGTPQGGRPPQDKDWAKISLLMGDLLEKAPTHDAYPDLKLPPNPITGLTCDTTPDFFLYNNSDVKMSNSNLLEILFGSGATNLPKQEGLKEALAAIEFSAQGIRQLYGVQEGVSGGVLSAEKGRDGVYEEFNDGRHETRHKKKGLIDQFLDGISREEPSKLGSLIEGSSEKPIVMETNLSQRLSNKNYSREIGLDLHLQYSIHRSEFDGVVPENQNKLLHIYSGDEYKRIFSEFEKNYESEHYAVRRSFPTFKVFFIEESGEISANTDSKLAAKLTKAVALDDFYGVNSIKEIRIVKNKMHAADTCIISLLDLDGVLYNRNYLEQDSEFGLRTTRSKQRRNPFLDTIIKEGMKVVVKFGFSNDANELENVFVGQIVGWEGSKVVDIICQSYGSELVSHRFGSDTSENADFWNVTTGDLLHDMMDREEIRHFGRWELKDVDLTGKLFGVEKLRPDGKIKKVWSWKPSVVDDNLFIPEFETYADGFDKFFGDLEYVLFDTTVWDVFKEMELRHPGYIAYPVPYGNGSDVRMTMFFGNPGMEYLARPAGTIEEIEAEIASNNINTVAARKSLIKLGEHIWKHKPENERSWFQRKKRFRFKKTPIFIESEEQESYAVGLEAIADGNDDSLEELSEKSGVSIDDIKVIRPYARHVLNKVKGLLDPGEITKDRESIYNRIDPGLFWKATMLYQEGRMKTFRNYELVTSNHDIIANNIRCDHRDTFNSVELRYSDNDVDLGDFAQGDDVESLTVTADDNIKEHHIRRTIESWPNCTTENLARRYASQLMANSLKRIYKGELIICGRPTLKPYDFIWLYDNYSDMAGPIEVEEVVHTFSSETGFITEVVPNMIVAVKEEVTTLTTDAMGAFFTEHLKEFTSGATVGLGLGAAGLLTKGIIAGRAATAVAAAEAGNIGGTVAAAGKTVLGVPTVALAGTTAIGLEAEKDLAEFDRDDRPGRLTGLGVGLGAAGLWAINPLIPSVAGIIAGAMLYKVLKYNATREPIIITPLIKQGKPFVSGLETMESDGLLITDMFSKDKKDAAYEAFIGRKWRYFIDGFEDANAVIEQGWANWISR